MPHLFDVEHYFLLSSANKGGTVFTQGESFCGVALWFFDVNQLVSGFDAMNAALKTRAENVHQEPGTGIQEPEGRGG